MHQQRLATIEDVAAIAGVSIATVSRAINEPGQGRRRHAPPRQRRHRPHRLHHQRHGALAAHAALQHDPDPRAGRRRPELFQHPRRPRDRGQQARLWRADRQHPERSRRARPTICASSAPTRRRADPAHRPPALRLRPGRPAARLPPMVAVNEPVPGDRGAVRRRRQFRGRPHRRRAPDLAGPPAHRLHRPFDQPRSSTSCASAAIARRSATPASPSTRC